DDGGHPRLPRRMGAAVPPSGWSGCAPRSRRENQAGRTTRGRYGARGGMTHKHLTEVAIDDSFRNIRVNFCALSLVEVLSGLRYRPGWRPKLSRAVSIPPQPQPACGHAHEAAPTRKDGDQAGYWCGG